MLSHQPDSSAAGKTQLALQLSLSVQLPPSQGGLSGACCFISTRSGLPTPRLLQMSQLHPRIDSSFCTLDDIYTIHTGEFNILAHVLSATLPELIAEKQEGTKPVRLVIIDALTELFHSETKTSSTSLWERSKSIVQLSTLLHSLAAAHSIAVVVLNAVTDVFDHPSEFAASSQHEGTQPLGFSADVLYKEQARWFNRANSLPGEDRKQADLGLVWANQVNARLMLSRTGRRRYLDASEIRALKRRKFNDGDPEVDTNTNADDALLIRRLTVIFSSVSRPGSVDYVVTEGGISCFHDPSENTLSSPPPSLAPVPRAVAVSPPTVAASDDPIFDPEPNPLGSDVDPFQQAEDALPSSEPNVVQNDNPNEAAEQGPQDDEDMYWGDGDDDLYDKLYEASFNVSSNAPPSLT